MNKNEVMDKVEAAEFLGMTPRNLNRLMETRLVPYVRVFFSAERSGMVFFSRVKLEEYERHSDIEDLEGMTEAQKEVWRFEKNMNMAIESRKESEEKVLVVKIQYLSKKLKEMLDVKNTELSEDAKAKRVKSSDIFSDYLALIPKLHELEKRRLLEFFGEACVLQSFPDLFKTEIEAKRKGAETEKLVKERHGGIEPESIQVVEQSQADEGRMIYHQAEKEEE